MPSKSFVCVSLVGGRHLPFTVHASSPSPLRLGRGWARANAHHTSKKKIGFCSHEQLDTEAGSGPSVQQVARPTDSVLQFRASSAVHIPSVNCKPDSPFTLCVSCTLYCPHKVSHLLAKLFEMGSTSEAPRDFRFSCC